MVGTASTRMYLSVGLLCLFGCAEQAPPVSYLDPAAGRQQLGWLGAEAHPLRQALDLAVDGNVHSPGGLVLAQVLAEGPLAKAGARGGDVLVRTGADWVPLKEDPTLDVIARVEQAISARQSALSLSCWRGDELVELALPLDRPALEKGLPLDVERFREGQARGLARLSGADLARASMGSKVDSAGALAATALTALAARGAAAGEELAARCSERIAPLLAATTGADEPVSLALASLCLAESSGPLPKEMLIEAAREKAMESLPAPLREAMAGMPAGGGGHGTFTMQLDSTEDLSSLLDSLRSGGSEVQVFRMDGSGGDPPDLPEGMVFSELPEGFSFSSEGMPEGFLAGEGGSFPPPPPPDIRALLAESQPERLAALDALQAAVDRLVALQGDTGSWPASPALASDAFTSTTLALTALGRAQAAGLMLPEGVVASALAYLRPELHDGQIAGAVARGADRRTQGGRAACAALALKSLGCKSRDEFFQALVDYSNERGETLLQAPSGRLWQLLSLALLRRQLGMQEWQKFYDEFRIALVAWQAPDGSFHLPAGPGAGAEERALCASPVADAVGTLILALQTDHRPVLTGEAQNPFARPIDGHGTSRVSVFPGSVPLDAGELPEGFSGTLVSDPEEAQRLLQALEDGSQSPQEDSR